MVYKTPESMSGRWRVHEWKVSVYDKTVRCCLVVVWPQGVYAGLNDVHPSECVDGACGEGGGVLSPLISVGKGPGMVRSLAEKC